MDKYKIRQQIKIFLENNLYSDTYHEKRNEVENLRNEISKNLNITLDLYYVEPETGPALKLPLIKVPKELQKQGLGTKAMNTIINYADQNNLRIFLTPATDWGSSKTGLLRFYKSLGFVNHSGKNRDYHFKDDMVRLPNSIKSKKMNEELRKKIREYFKFFIIKENTEQEIIDYNRKNIQKIYSENASEILKIIMSYPDIWLQEVGIEVILNFLSEEDSMNFRLQHGMTSGNPVVFKSKESKGENEDELDYILRSNKINYTWKEIKNRLVQYFAQGIIRNLPRDRKIETKEEFMKFIDTYKEAFLYGYIIVMANMAK